MTDPPPVAELVHCMPGRTRLRIAARRGDAQFFTALAAGLSAYPGVTKVAVAALTGSVLIRHIFPLHEIVAAAEKAGLFRVGKADAPSPAPIEWPRLPVDPKLAIAAGLGLIALWQLGRGKALPPALTLAWYATHLAGIGIGKSSFDSSD